MGSKFEASLKAFKEAMDILSRTDLCLTGCSELVAEAPSTYWERAKVIDCKCVRCGKVRWTK